MLLAAACAWRLAGYRREFLADAGDPRRAFAVFTFAAGSDVLAARLAGDGHSVAAAALPAAGGASWLLLSYSPPLLAGRERGSQAGLPCSVAVVAAVVG